MAGTSREMVLAGVFVVAAAGGLVWWWLPPDLKPADDPLPDAGPVAPRSQEDPFRQPAGVTAQVVELPSGEGEVPSPAPPEAALQAASPEVAAPAAPVLRIPEWPAFLACAPYVLFLDASGQPRVAAVEDPLLLWRTPGDSALTLKDPADDMFGILRGLPERDPEYFLIAGQCHAGQEDDAFLPYARVPDGSYEPLPWKTVRFEAPGARYVCFWFEWRGLPVRDAIIIAGESRLRLPAEVDTLHWVPGDLSTLRIDRQEPARKVEGVTDGLVIQVDGGRPRSCGPLPSRPSGHPAPPRPHPPASSSPGDAAHWPAPRPLRGSSARRSRRAREAPSPPTWTTRGESAAISGRAVGASRPGRASS